MTFRTAVLLTALATGIYAGNGGTVQARAEIGSFDAFTDTQCNEGGVGFTVDDASSAGTLGSDVTSVKSYLPDCSCKCLYLMSVIFAPTYNVTLTFWY